MSLWSLQLAEIFQLSLSQILLNPQLVEIQVLQFVFYFFKVNRSMSSALQKIFSSHLVYATSLKIKNINILISHISHV